MFPLVHDLFFHGHLLHAMYENEDNVSHDPTLLYDITNFHFCYCFGLVTVDSPITTTSLSSPKKF